MFWRAILLVLLVLAGVAPVFLATTNGQGTDISVLYVSPTTSHSSSSFTIYVYLNLSSLDQFNAYDMHLTYNSSVLHVQSLIAAPGAQELANCVNGVGMGCTINDGPDIVHSAASFSTIFQGPVPGLLLFSVQFGIVGTGTSLFHPFNDTLANPNPAAHPFPHLTQDGIYSNRAVTAFFNTSPAIPIVNQNVSFDGSGSFTIPSGVGIAAYSWDFGDSSMTGRGSVVSHNYTASASYKVTLTVTDKSGGVGKILKSMFVSADLGGINVNIRAVGGNQVASQVIAGLYNGSVFVENRTKPVATTGSVSFLGLKPGSYRVSFSGPGVVVSSMVETVIPGWITYDTAFLTIVDQPRSDSLGFYILLLVVIGGGIALGSVAILRRRHGKRKQ